MLPVSRWQKGRALKWDRKPTAATLQAQSGKADLLERHVRNEEVHGVAEHVLAEIARPPVERRRSMALVAGER